MLTRHTNEMMNRLDRIADIGVAEIRRSELKIWFGQERLTVNVWRELNDKWRETLASDGYSDDEIDTIPLFMAEADGVFVLIWGSKLQFDESDEGAEPFFYPMSNWMIAKERKSTGPMEPVAVEYGLYTIKRDSSGTVSVEESGEVVTPTRPVLRKIAKKLGVSIVNSKNNPLNTRQLGGDLISAINTQSVA